MATTEFRVPDTDAKRFLDEYARPGVDSPKRMSHDGLCVATDSAGIIYSLLAEEPVAPLVKGFGAEMVRQYPNNEDYLGRFSTLTNTLFLYGPSYNDGRPGNEILTAGFRRLAELFGVDIELK